MTPRTLEQERLACSPMGNLEFVVECRHDDRVETWLVLRPHPGVASSYQPKGKPLPQGCRLVVDAHSLRPLGVLAGSVPPPTPSAMGHNPYFDLAPS